MHEVAARFSGNYTVRTEVNIPALKLREDFRPVTDLKTHGAAIVRQVADTGRPVVLSRHGRPVAILLSVDEYEDLCEQTNIAALRTALAEAEADVAAGRTIPHEEMKKKFARLLDDKG